MPVVTDLLVFSASYTREKFVTLLGSAEASSEHPLGRSIYAYAKNQLNGHGPMQPCKVG